MKRIEKIYISIDIRKVEWYNMDKINEKEESEMNATINIVRPCSIAESIKQSCQEVKLMREGKIPKRSWNDFTKRMEKEIAEDE